MSGKNLFAAIATDKERLTRQYQTVFRAPLRSRAIVFSVAALLLAIFALGLAGLEISIGRIGSGLVQVGFFLQLMWPPLPGPALPLYLHALAETLAIALLGTLAGAVLAFPFALLAARNVVPNWIFHFGARRFLDSLRSVDILIWGLIWINVVGLGPFAGILAIASSDFGAFGKIFSELVEATERKSVEAIRSTGGNGWHELRFGILPQVFPVMAGQVLYFIESNTRSATIIGAVGAGGIGLHLFEEIRTLEWQHVAFLVAMLLVTVSIIDMISSRLRMAIMGQASRH